MVAIFLFQTAIAVFSFDAFFLRISGIAINTIAIIYRGKCVYIAWTSKSSASRLTWRSTTNVPFICWTCMLFWIAWKKDIHKFEFNIFCWTFRISVKTLHGLSWQDTAIMIAKTKNTEKKTPFAFIVHQDFNWLLFFFY